MWLEDPGTQKLARADRYGYSVQALNRFFDADRDAGYQDGLLMVDDLTDDRIDRFIDFRKRDGVKGETIHGDLVALRRGLSWATRRRHLTALPFIKDVDRGDRSGPREVEFDMAQVAAILEAAARIPDRHHVRLFALIMLSSHARCEAVLELYDHQIQRDIFHFNAPGRVQTKKRRARVPVATVLRPWLQGISGKVIVYRTPIAERKWADPKVPEFFVRPCYDIGKALEACQVEAGLAHPTLGLVRPVLDVDGNPVLKDDVPQWRGIGTPNTFRHSCHTYHQTVGTPQGQIDMAAGHAEPGSGRNYSHLRPEYLKDFMAATDAYWEEMKRYTTVHLRSHVPATVIDLGARRG